MRPLKSVAAMFALLMSTLIVIGSHQANVMARQVGPSTSLTPANQPLTEAENSPTVPDKSELEQMRSQLARQQLKIEELERRLDEQKTLMEQFLHLNSDASATTVLNQPRDTARDSTSTSASTEEVAKAPAGINDEAAPETTTTKPLPQKEDAAPLAFKIGKLYLSPVGFLDVTSTVRSRNVGSGLGTNFAGIPFSNTTSGNLSEFRFTAQNSRLGLRMDAKLRGSDFLGYFETDFLGFSPGNVAVTTNSNNMRVRLLWLDARKKKWEILGGQSWSLLTPNRNGLSPLPGDVFSTLNVDPNLQLGMTWSRDAQFRVVCHAGESVTLGVSLEAAEQYGGGSAGAGVITLPPALESSYAPQLDTGNSTFGVPNLHPDIIAKIAFDPKFAGRHLHLEVAGLVSSFKFFNPADQQTHGATGGGGSVGINYEVIKNLRLISNGFYSDGGGRWIFGLGPDLIIKPDGSPSLVHSASTVSGFEYQPNSNNLFDAYYGGAYIQRNTAIDLNGRLVGYGYTDSPTNHNRSLQELTLGYNRTFWRDPNYGALQFLTQYSYVVRHPWSVEPGQPGNAHLNMLYLNLRYLFPGAPPAKK